MSVELIKQKMKINISLADLLIELGGEDSLYSEKLIKAVEKQLPTYAKGEDWEFDFPYEPVELAVIVPNDIKTKLWQKLVDINPVFLNPRTKQSSFVPEQGFFWIADIDVNEVPLGLQLEEYGGQLGLWLYDNLTEEYIEQLSLALKK